MFVRENVLQETCSSSLLGPEPAPWVRKEMFCHREKNVVKWTVARLHLVVVITLSQESIEDSPSERVRKMSDL